MQDGECISRCRWHGFLLHVSLSALISLMIPQLLCPHQFPFFEKNFARKPAQHFHFAGAQLRLRLLAFAFRTYCSGSGISDLFASLTSPAVEKYLVSSLGIRTILFMTSGDLCNPGPTRNSLQSYAAATVNGSRRFRPHEL